MHTISSATYPLVAPSRPRPARVRFLGAWSSTGTARSYNLPISMRAADTRTLYRRRPVQAAAMTNTRWKRTMKTMRKKMRRRMYRMAMPVCR